MPALWTAGASFAVPVGTVVVGGRYGLNEDVELRARLHAAGLLKGIAAVEGGGVWHALPAQGWRPGLTVTGDLSVLTSPRFFGDGFSRSVRGALDVAGIAHLEPLAWLWPYVVVDNGLILADGSYVLSLFLGAQAHVGRFELSLEAGLAGINDDTRRRTQPYVGLAGHGALWLAWAVAYRFGAEP